MAPLNVGITVHLDDSPVSELATAFDGEILYSLVSPKPSRKGCRMAKPNYAFAKRQKDLAKKQKKEEKRLRKTGTTSQPQPQDIQPLPRDDTKTVPDGS